MPPLLGGGRHQTMMSHLVSPRCHTSCWKACQDCVDEVPHPPHCLWQQGPLPACLSAVLQTQQEEKAMQAMPNPNPTPPQHALRPTNPSSPEDVTRASASNHVKRSKSTPTPRSIHKPLCSAAAQAAMLEWSYSHAPLHALAGCCFLAAAAAASAASTWAYMASIWACSSSSSMMAADDSRDQRQHSRNQWQQHDSVSLPVVHSTQGQAAAAPPGSSKVACAARTW